MNALPDSIRHRPCYRGSTRYRLAYPLFLLLLALFLSTGLTALRAQDTASDNPTGPTGDYNGEVTTAGSYDPFTQNAKRAITDLVVPGSNGIYPLAFSRIYNSAVYLTGIESRVLGDGGNWRHSYMWSLWSASSSGQVVTAYNVSYPDGGVITFRSGRSNAPSGESSAYWHGPSGTADRLEVTSGGVVLHKSDGGLIYFGGNFRPYMIVDPYGAATTLQYNASLLTKVTEPGGRWLQFAYSTYTDDIYYVGADEQDHQISTSWVLLSQVTASTGQTVNYTYGEAGEHVFQPTSQYPYGYSVPYIVLTAATYNSEPSIAGTGNVQAGYTYEYASGGIPVLKAATDPHYGGAMVGIQYQYTSQGSGLIQEEQNLAGTRVSKLARSLGVNTSSSTETRGDKTSGGADITRSFNYGETMVNGGTSNAKPSQLTSCTDYEGHATYLSYYGANSPCGEGNLFSVTDARGNSTIYSHEPYVGKVNFMQLPDGRIRSWYWFSKDLTTGLQPYYLLQYTDERGQATTYFRDHTTGQITQIDYPDGGHEYFTYATFTCNGNAFKKVYCHTDQRGAQTIYGYDETDVNHGGSGLGHVGLLTSVTRSYLDSTNTLRQERTVLYYDTLDRPTQSVDQRGVTTQLAYNGRHQLTRTTHAYDSTHTDCYYNDLGECYQATDELGHASYTTYDEYRRPTVVVQNVLDGINDHHVDYYTYDPRDTSHNSYASATSHTRSTWSFHQQQSGHAIWHVYSPNNWLTDTYVGNEHTVHTDYNAVGLAQTSTDGLGFYSTCTYDQCNRLATATDPNSHVSTTSYYGANETASGGGGVNCAGLLKSVTVPGPDTNLPTVTTQSANYDQMARLRQTVAPPNGGGIPNVTFNSGYNAAGDLTSQDDGAQASGGHQTGYGYDQLGRKASCTYPDSTVERWTYDDSGNVTTYVNRSLKTKVYSYDMRNRLTYAYWTGNEASSTGYEYDAASRMTRVYNWYSDNHFTYSQAGELLSESAQLPGMPVLTTYYTHDIDGRVTDILYPSGHNPEFTYDTQGRCTGVYNKPNHLALTQYNYDGRGLLSSRCMPLIGLDTSYTYQNNGRVSSVWHYRGDAVGNHATNGSVRRQFYGYAPDGQVSWTCRAASYDQTGRNSALDDGRGDAYYYYADGSLSAAYRNMGVSGGWPAQQSSNQDARVDTNNFLYYGGATPSDYLGYVYDRAGNRTYAGGWAYQLSYSPDGENRYVGMGYDGNGNTTNALLGWTYNYDAENRLMSTSGPGGQAMAFAYDGLGRMTAENINGLAKVYYYAGSQRIEERNNATQAPLCQYFFDGPQSDSIFLRADEQLGYFWYLYDAQGNTTHLCDNGGNVLEMYLYDAYGTPTVYTPYGNVRTSNDQYGNAKANISAYDNRYLFKGAAAYQWYVGAGLYYCRARFYQSSHGRWLQPDPIGQKGGLNIYTYCHNDPINKNDPNGFADNFWWVLIGGYHADETRDLYTGVYNEWKNNVANNYHPPSTGEAVTTVTAATIEGSLWGPEGTALGYAGGIIWVHGIPILQAIYDGTAQIFSPAPATTTSPYEPSPDFNTNNPFSAPVHINPGKGSVTPVSPLSTDIDSDDSDPYDPLNLISGDPANAQNTAYYMGEATDSIFATVFYSPSIEAATVLNPISPMYGASRFDPNGVFGAGSSNAVGIDMFTRGSGGGVSRPFAGGGTVGLMQAH